MSPRHPIVPGRIHIDQLELDLRGFPREIAESVARRVGPALTGALSAALAEHPAGTASTKARSSDPHALAMGIAHRLAARIVSGGS
jgi:hypothetical protein